MPVIKVSAHLPFLSGLEEDVAINAFYFSQPDAFDILDIDALTARMEAFYGEMGPYISGYVSRPSCFLRFAVIDPTDGTETEDAVIRPFEVAGANGTNLPMEVAVCLSYKVAFPGPSSRGSSKGRVYIGPLTSGAVTGNAGTGAPRVSTACVTDLLNAGKALGDAGGARWVLWSRKDGAVFEIAAVIVDNEFDTQRRRGLDATLRLTEDIDLA